MSYVIPVESSMGCTAPGPLLTSVLLAPSWLITPLAPGHDPLELVSDKIRSAIYGTICNRAQKCRRP